jgi:hypothetical protein
MSVSTAASVLKKVAARAALVNVDGRTASILRDCFKQFGIDVTTLRASEAERLHHEKVDACVINLDENAADVLEMARNSPSNKRLVVFGISDSPTDAVRFSKYGVNVLLDKSLDRSTALRAVRSTHLLIINEFRRYVRIPIVAPMDALCGVQHITGSTLEVSGGGMSIRYKGKLSLNDDVQAAFDLPGQSGLKLRGVVCWVRPSDSSAGVRFEPTDQPARELVKKWIDGYLEIV